MRGTRGFRATTYLYPRGFRREYGASMEQLFADRVRDHGRWRAWTSTLRDLAITVPHENWERIMDGPPTTKLTAAALATATAAVVFFAVGGAILGLVLLVLLAWQFTSIVKTRSDGTGTTSWWKFAVSGVGLFVALFAFFAGPWPQDWRDQVNGTMAWTVAMFGFNLAIVLIVIGGFLGIAQWAGRRRPAA
jgi:hypothetical protein